MDLDLSELLRDWEYTPGQINVRLIQGSDGQKKVQVRLDLGILQMNMDGRPDGQQPEGFPSLLEYHQARMDARDEDRAPAEEDHEADTAGPDLSGPDLGGPGVEEDPVSGSGGGEDGLSDGTGSGDGALESEGEQGGSAGPYVLSEEECRTLREEAAQFYHRYVALLVLEEFQAVVRDTTRNLRVLDLCRKHAMTESDRLALEQFRPYIMMMRARAFASQALSDNEPKAAIAAIDEGLDGLRQYFSDVGQVEHFDEAAEVQMLRGMREALIPKLPVSQGAELRERLRQAVDSENYELAAILRDELKMLGEGKPQA